MQIKSAVKTQKDRWGTIWNNTYGNMWEFQSPQSYLVPENNKESSKKYVLVVGQSSTLRHGNQISWS
jgi:hypothetical protein